MANLVEYVKTVWENGKTALNASRMNNMEQGISNCATQINKLWDSVSQKSETVTGTYGRVLFQKNGPVCYVESTFDVEQQLSTGAWINICDTPSWVNAKYDWLNLMDSSGKIIGVWAVSNGKLRILIQNQSKNLVIKGLLMLN